MHYMRSSFFRLLVIGVCLAVLSTLLLRSTNLLSTAQSVTQSNEGKRELKIKTFDGAPVAIQEVRNLQKQEDWLRDLEIEVKNVSDKPVCFISLIVYLPNIPAPAPTPGPDGKIATRSTTGFVLRFGETRLADIRGIASPTDILIQPGELYVFKVPDLHVEGLKNMERRMNLPPDATNKIEIRLDTVSFGDGTGFIGKLRRDFRIKKVGRLNPPKEPAFRKASWGISAPVRAKPQTGCGSCSPYYIV